MAQNRALSLGSVGNPCCCGPPPFSEPACGCNITLSSLTLNINNLTTSFTCLGAGPIGNVALTYGVPPALSAIALGWWGTFPIVYTLGTDTGLAVLQQSAGGACNLSFFDETTVSFICTVHNTDFLVKTCSPLNMVWTYNAGSPSGLPGDCFNNTGCGGSILTLTITP